MYTITYVYNETHIIDNNVVTKAFRAFFKSTVQHLSHVIIQIGTQPKYSAISDYGKYPTLVIIKRIPFSSFFFSFSLRNVCNFSFLRCYYNMYRYNNIEQQCVVRIVTRSFSFLSVCRMIFWYTILIVPMCSVIT